MNITEAFTELDFIGNTKSLKESVASDELRQLVSDIEQLDQEIKSLYRQKHDSWETNHVEKYKSMDREIRELETELSKLVKTYTYVTYRDADGHPEEWEEDPKRKAEVAEQETELRNKLTSLRAEYKQLLNDARKEHEAEFETHTKTIQDKTTAKQDKEARREAALKVVSEEEHKELETLCAKINEYIAVTPDWDSFKISKGQMFLDLIGEPFDYEVSVEDFDDDDDFMVDHVLEAIEEDVEEEDFFSIVEALGIDEHEAEKGVGNNALLDIPGSSWKLLGGVDIEIIGDEPRVTTNKYYPGSWEEPPYHDFEYDEYMKVRATYYLVKPI